MTPSDAASLARLDPPARSGFSRWLSEEREHIADHRFWIVQALVLVLAGLHAVAEGVYHYHESFGHASEALYFIPEALFLIPVGYAALNFGLRGSVLTAVWCTALAVPNLLAWHHGEQIAGTVLQLGILNVIAIFVGQRVDHEVGARRQAEAAHAALEASEMRYRNLFQTSGEPALVFDRDGTVRDANAAAAQLFDRSPSRLIGAGLADVLPEDQAAALRSFDAGAPREIVHMTTGGQAVYLQPIVAAPLGDNGDALTQVLFRNVTAERARREELRTYASHIVRAQEEERRRAGQQLHDDVLQNLIILLRQLDGIEDRLKAAPGEPVPLTCARKTTEELIDRVRAFAHGLRPPSLEDLGLVPTLRRLIGDAGARSPLRAALVLEGDARRLPAETELGLYRIAQEAIVNVERHAMAKSMTVSLRFRKDEVELVIRDDGVGFDRNEVQARRLEGRNLGMVGMEERAAFLGGTFQIASASNGGTTVSVTVAVLAPPS